MKQNNTNILSNLLLWQKFLVLGVIAFFLVILPSYLFIKAGQNRIVKFEQAQQSLDNGSKLMSILKSTQKHRGLAAVVLFGDKSKEADLLKEKTALNEKIAAFDTVMAGMDYPELADNWKQLKENWQKISDGLATRKIDRQDLWELHTNQINLAKESMLLILGNSNMTLDDYPRSYFLVQGIMSGLPELFDQMGLARAYGREFLERATSGDNPDKRTKAEMVKFRDQLAETAKLSRTSLKSNSTQLLLGVSNIPVLKASLEASIKNLKTLAEVPLKLTEKVVDPQAKSYPTIDDFRGKYNDATDAIYDLIKTSTEALNKQIVQQIEQERKSQHILLGILVAMSVLGAILATFIVKSITGPVNGLLGVMQRLASGDSNARSSLNSADEIGRLGRQFNEMVDQRETLRTKIQDENDTLNDSVIDLLKGVAQLAQRNLTVKVPVAENITGPVADALNMLSGETASVLNKVVQIANDIEKVSNHVQNQSAMVINVAAEEKREVEQAASELSQASQAMRDIAKLAASCNEAAQKAINNTDRAQSSVTDTVQGITTIRDTIRETEKRIKRLGERSQEIGGVVNLINEISERTHILALNASMHAASAGEAGRGFAVVANEVQKLSENSREATAKIAALVNNIQVETADTVITMNDAISQVVRGTDLAQQAGNEMRETRNTTAELVQLVQRISENSTVQSETSLRLVERAQQIQKSTSQTYSQLQEQGHETNSLVDLSKNLVTSVGVFTLPKTAA